eukprot:CAMPEP_0182911048 /NCGR_PEP_ID=MMETSP0034_2-20130328/36688_1 /TAXON_ID=156128 /ORGANISM="Nephroselmis pyriformis, Strain CCMP717" /LENGTH=63 /DNA_ID=CAMNT_0025047495 /DNA_START=75 /DNA_END=262 /DNA_ORIENTATION=+
MAWCARPAGPASRFWSEGGRAWGSYGPAWGSHVRAGVKEERELRGLPRHDSRAHQGDRPDPQA